MKEFKTCLSLYKYSKDFKTNIACSFLYCAISIFMLCVMNKEDGDMILLPATFIVLGPVLSVQVIYSLEVIGLINSSAIKEYIEKRFMDVMQLIYSMTGYLIIVVSVIIKIMMGANGEDYVKGIIASGIVIAVIVVYSVLAVKKPIAGFIIYLVGYASAMFLACSNIRFEFHLNVSVIFGLVLVLTGCGLSAVLRRSLYKIPIRVFLNRKSV